MWVNAESSRRVAVGFHLLAAGWILAMLSLGRAVPDTYRMLLQEDHAIEWTTFWLFLAAGAVGVARAIPPRRLFDLLVGVFCIFVAGEEISWGQRLVGYAAPEFFLRANVQQEVNLHNLPQSLQPGLFLMLALAGYGVLLPAATQVSSFAAVVSRVGATAPPLALVPWFAGAILLLWWYPLTLTGEWVETLAGTLFLASAMPVSRRFWSTVAATAGLGVAMMVATTALERERDDDRIACARAEVQSLGEGLARGGAALPQLWELQRVHKRLWSSIRDEYVNADRLGGFHAVSCGSLSGDTTELRRKYGIDPWGSPYWVLVERQGPSGSRLTVYSFGPNRRRDLSEGGDDIIDARRID